MQDEREGCHESIGTIYERKVEKTVQLNGTCLPDSQNSSRNPRFNSGIGPNRIMDCRRY